MAARSAPQLDQPLIHSLRAPNRGSIRFHPPPHLQPIAVAFAAGQGLTGRTPPEPDIESQWAIALQASWRIPLAAALGALLAFRPRRRGTPARETAVVQTQIILAIVGAVVMLVVGSSVARAFGIVGAASLVRYRAKIDDPKDAGIMLSALGIGLASGVGLYVLAIFATLFIALVVGVLESFEPESYKLFDLKVKAKEAPTIRPASRLSCVATRSGSNSARPPTMNSCTRPGSRCRRRSMASLKRFTPSISE